MQNSYIQKFEEFCGTVNPTILDFFSADYSRLFHVHYKCESIQIDEQYLLLSEALHQYKLMIFSGMDACDSDANLSDVLALHLDPTIDWV